MLSGLQGEDSSKQLGRSRAAGSTPVQASGTGSPGAGYRFRREVIVGFRHAEFEVSLRNRVETPGSM